MSDKIIWAPWRIKYIQKRTKGCLFCKVSKSKNDKQNFLVKRGKLSFSFLNLYPYNNGHIMIAPYRHTGDITKLSEAELLDLMHNLKEVTAILDKTLKSQGYNVGINIGRVAGAGFPGHIHIHVVPRWQGDTNFMPAIAGTKVLSQSLEELYKKLKYAYQKRY